VLLRRHVKSSKTEPQVDEVELVHATLNYARVRLPSGHESTVSLRDLAPTGERYDNVHDSQLHIDLSPHSFSPNDSHASTPPIVHEAVPDRNQSGEESTIGDHDSPHDHDTVQSELCRSTRVRRVPDRLTYYH